MSHPLARQILKAGPRHWGFGPALGYADQGMLCRTAELAKNGLPTGPYDNAPDSRQSILSSPLSRHDRIRSHPTARMADRAVQVALDDFLPWFRSQVLCRAGKVHGMGLTSGREGGTEALVSRAANLAPRTELDSADVVPVDGLFRYPVAAGRAQYDRRRRILCCRKPRARSPTRGPWPRRSFGRSVRITSSALPRYRIPQPGRPATVER